MADVEIVEVRDFALAYRGAQSRFAGVDHLSEPWLTRGRLAGAATTLLTTEFIPNFSGGTIMYGASMVNRDDDVGTRFMTAYLKGIADYQLGKTDANVASRSRSRSCLEDEVRAMCWPTFRPDGSIDEATTMEFQEGL
jgi:hypothetical protein